MNKIIKPRIRLENETEKEYKAYLRNFYFETNLPHPDTRYEFATANNLEDTEEVMDGENGAYVKYLEEYYKNYYSALDTQVNLTFNMGMLYTSNSFEEEIINEKEAKTSLIERFKQKRAERKTRKEQELEEIEKQEVEAEEIEEENDEEFEFDLEEEEIIEEKEAKTSLIERFKQKQAERKARKEEEKEELEDDDLEEEIVEEKEAKPSLIERFKQKLAERKTRKEKEDDNDEDFKFELAEEEDKEEEEIIEEKEKKPSLIERLKQKREERKENKKLKFISTVGLAAGIFTVGVGIVFGAMKFISPVLAWTAGIVGTVGIVASLVGMNRSYEDEYFDEEEFEEEPKTTKIEENSNKKDQKELVKSKEKEDSDFEFELDPEEDEEDKDFEFDLDPKEEEDKDFEFDLEPKEESIKSDLDAKKEAAIRQIIREEIENTALVVRPEKQLPRVLKK